MLSKRSLVKFVAIVALIGLSGLIYPPAAQAESLSQLLQRQAELQRQARESQAKIDQKQDQVNDLQGTIADLDDNITSTQAKITNTQDQIAVAEEVLAELTVDINQAQSQLDILQAKLNGAYSTLYELSQTSAIDSLLTAASLSDMVTQSQYIQSLQTELQTTIDQQMVAKADLETKKTESETQKAGLQSLKQDLTKSSNALNSKRTQKNYLLLQTQGEQAQYEALLKKLQSEQENISQAIYDARSQSGNGRLLIGGTGGYPWSNEPNSYAVDPWLFYKRQCTSFAAWKFQAVYGLVFYNTRPGQGSAYNWRNLAQDQGYQTSSTPRVNSIVSLPIGPNMPYGHVAWVTRVNTDGTINVEEFNWSSSRNYDTRTSVDMSRYGNVTYIYP